MALVDKDSRPRGGAMKSAEVARHRESPRFLEPQDWTFLADSLPLGILEPFLQITELPRL